MSREANNANASQPPPPVVGWGRKLAPAQTSSGYLLVGNATLCAIIDRPAGDFTAVCETRWSARADLWEYFPGCSATPPGEGLCPVCAFYALVHHEHELDAHHIKRCKTAIAAAAAEAQARANTTTHEPCAKAAR